MVQKIGRNDPCPCRSGTKYKNCCGKTMPFNEDGYTFLSHFTRSNASSPEIGTREGAIIVKVQTALNDPDAPAFIYDRGHTFQRYVDAAQVIDRMAGRPKVYFYARLGSSGQLVLEDEAPQQPW